jgi:hypothetical protein
MCVPEMHHLSLLETEAYIVLLEFMCATWRLAHNTYFPRLAGNVCILCRAAIMCISGFHLGHSSELCANRKDPNCCTTWLMHWLSTLSS